MLMTAHVIGNEVHNNIFYLRQKMNLVPSRNLELKSESTRLHKKIMEFQFKVQKGF